MLRSKHYSHFKCSGTEENLSECQLTEGPYNSCSSEYAGVVCTTESNGMIAMVHNLQVIEPLFLAGSQGLTLTTIISCRQPGSNFDHHSLGTDNRHHSTPYHYPLAGPEVHSEEVHDQA